MIEQENQSDEAENDTANEIQSKNVLQGNKIGG